MYRRLTIAAMLAISALCIIACGGGGGGDTKTAAEAKTLLDGIK